MVPGRIVIIGGQFEDRDRHLTPFSVMGGGRATGAEIHAQIAAQVKDGRKLSTLTTWQKLGLGAGIAFVGFVLAYLRRLGGGFGDYILLGGTLVLVGGLAFSRYDVILPSDTMSYAALASIVIGHNGLRWFRALRSGRLPRM